MTKITEECYWIAFSDDKTKVHYGQLTSGRVVSTGQPNVEKFETEDEWKTRLTELGVELEDNSNDETEE